MTAACFRRLSETDMRVINMPAEDTHADDVDGYCSDEVFLPGSPSSARSAGSVSSLGSAGSGGPWAARMEEMGKELKTRLAVLKSRVERTLLPAGKPLPQREGPRTLHLDFHKSLKSRRCPECEQWGDEEGQKNLTPTMVVRSILEGMFCAELPLASLPEGDLILRERCHRLFLLTGDPTAVRTLPPTTTGYIDLPIFLDADSMNFALSKDTGDVLIMCGLMKGSGRKKLPDLSHLSLSSGHLRRSSSQSLTSSMTSLPGHAHAQDSHSVAQKRMDRANSY